MPFEAEQKTPAKQYREKGMGWGMRRLVRGVLTGWLEVH
jgi:hypothetical protein